LELNLSSLREAGIDSLGDRINILHAILALKESWANNLGSHGPNTEYSQTEKASESFDPDNENAKERDNSNESTSVRFFFLTSFLFFTIFLREKPSFILSTLMINHYFPVIAVFSGTSKI